MAEHTVLRGPRPRRPFRDANRARCARWKAVSFDLHAGRTLGIVGESGCGKSVTARSILRILDRPGRIIGGRILLDPGASAETDLTALDPESRRMRGIRGGRIGLIFQEPMTALSVHYTVGNQIIEAVRQHSDLSKAAARDRAIELLGEVGIPRPELRVDAYPFQLAAGFASASASPWHWPAIPTF